MGVFREEGTGTRGEEAVTELPSPQAQVAAMTREFVMLMREHGIAKLRYVHGEETWELELSPGARALRPEYGVDVSRPIPHDEDAFLDDRSPELKEQDRQRQEDADLFGAVGVVPDYPSHEAP